MDDKLILKNSPLDNDASKTLFYLVVLTGAIQIILSTLWINWLDLGLFYTWGQGLFDGFFNAYDGHIAYLDYPPGYFGFLWLIGAVSRAVDLEIISEHMPLIQLVTKFFPILFNLACAVLIYKIACLYGSSKTGLNAALIWLLNPAVLINCVWWGQIDTLLMLLLLLSYYLLETNRLYAAAAVFAFACVTKFQTCFFLPVFICAVLFRYPLKKTLPAGLVGVGVVLGVFLPFMISYGSALLPLKLYTKSYGSYPYVTLYAYNFYGIFTQNRTYHTQAVFQSVPWLTYALIGRFFTFLSLFAPFGIYLFNKLRKASTDLWVVSLLVMQTLFMFATMMHERYQIAVLPLLLVLYLKYRDKRWLALLWGISTVLAISEFHVLMSYTVEFSAWWKGGGGDFIQSFFSVINVFFYLFSVILCYRYLFGRPPEKEKLSVGGTPDESESIVAESQTE